MNTATGWKINLNTVHIPALRSGCPACRAILAAQRDDKCFHFSLVGDDTRRRVCRLLLFLLLLLLPLPNPAHSGTARIPFRTVQSLILVEGKVNGNPATFVFDTGSNRTIISTKTYGSARFDLQRIPLRRGSAGFHGYSLRRLADVSLASTTWTSQQVFVMNLDELKQMLHMDFDALLGQDFLRQFRSVRIDYRAHIIELEQ